MATIRRGPLAQDHFTQIANDALRDSRLSWGAVGLLSWLLSHSEGWETSERRIALTRAAGRKAVRAMIHELEEFGYLSRDGQNRSGKGRFGSAVWVVTDAPSVVPSGDHGLATVVPYTDRGPGDHIRRPTKEDQPFANFAVAKASVVGERFDFGIEEEPF